MESQLGNNHACWLCHGSYNDPPPLSEHHLSTPWHSRRRAVCSIVSERAEKGYHPLQHNVNKKDVSVTTGEKTTLNALTGAGWIGRKVYDRSRSWMLPTLVDKRKKITGGHSSSAQPLECLTKKNVGTRSVC